jgi:hypothetical protein
MVAIIAKTICAALDDFGNGVGGRIGGLRSKFQFGRELSDCTLYRVVAGDLSPLDLGS